MKKSSIFQHNTFHTLTHGFYKGSISLSEALSHGDTGIGTLDGADGELIILDGCAYHGNASNEVKCPEMTACLPYVAVWNHCPTKSFSFERRHSKMLLDELLACFPTNSNLYSLKITGIFERAEITSKPANNTAPFQEILKQQPHFTKEEVEGTVVGIWSPKHLENLYGNGFHLHFLSQDKTFGGHLDNFTTSKVEIEIGVLQKIEQEFADEDDDFKKMNF